MSPINRGISAHPIVVHIGTGGSDSTPAHVYLVGPGKKKSDPAYEKSRGSEVPLPEGQSRVHSITGRIRGFEITEDTRLNAYLLTAETSGWPGKKKYKHAILSGKDIAPGKVRNDVLAALPGAARRYVDRFASEANYIAVVHQDRLHPHVHILIEAWDFALERRLDWRPSTLRRMQSVEDWAGVEFCSGRGTNSGAGPRRPPDKSPSSRDVVRDEKLRLLRQLLQGRETRESLFTSRRLVMKTYGKGGGELTRPGFSFEGEKFRADTVARAGFADICDLLRLPRERVERTKPEPSRLPRRPRIGVAGRPLDFDHSAWENGLAKKAKKAVLSPEARPSPAAPPRKVSSRATSLERDLYFARRRRQIPLPIRQSTIPKKKKPKL